MLYSPLAQTRCYRLCMYTSAILFAEKLFKKQTTEQRPSEQGPLKEQEASKHQGTIKRRHPPKCQILTVN